MDILQLLFQVGTAESSDRGEVLLAERFRREAIVMRLTGSCGSAQAEAHQAGGEI